MVVNTTSKYDKEAVFKLLERVKDPEIPVLSITEMGIVRDVLLEDDSCTVVITPTYSGCPAMMRIESDIKEHLEHHGFDNVAIKTVYSPVWTTDWMNDETKEKLRKYGIAPPTPSSYLRALGGESPDIPCPRCNSIDTSLISLFGSTPCKSMYKCDSCLEPFEHFKCH
jgi:ring-1,2-phenylacetyl-CoA epoxidase subunit PaaD